MILSDREIWMEIQSEDVVFDPPLEPQQVSPSSIDLRLSNTFTKFDKPAAGCAISVNVIKVINSEEVLQKHGKTISIGDHETIALEPGEFILGYTREYMKLPSYLAGRVEGRSSLARLGLTVHQTAPTVHATFEGQLRLEICNNGPFVCLLTPGIKVCQLILERLGTPAKSRLKSQWQQQREKPKA